MNMAKFIVDCIKDGDVFVSYEFGVPGTLAAPPQPNQQEILDEAKTTLANERRAMPPYTGITFNIRPA